MAGIGKARKRAHLRIAISTWAVLNFVLGFRRLGHDVWLIEPVEQQMRFRAGASLAESENAAYLRHAAALVFRRIRRGPGVGCRAFRESAQAFAHRR